MKKYLIFDLDWTLIHSIWNTVHYIINFLKDYEDFSEEKARYVLTNTAWSPLIKQVWIIFENFDEKKKKQVTELIYKWLLDLDAEFFEGIPEKITELKDNYKLFLTTWNSTNVAKKYLNKWWVLEYFEIIHWSDIILKWKDHLNSFKKYTGDEDFFKKSIYIWDWDSDRYFARESWIDFIHIWNIKKDKYEINSITEIDKILNIFK